MRTERRRVRRADCHSGRSVAQFDVLLALACGTGEHRALRFSCLPETSPPDFAAPLHRDATLRRRVAAAVGETLEDLDARGPELIRAAREGGLTVSRRF